MSFAHTRTRQPSGAHLGGLVKLLYNHLTSAAYLRICLSAATDSLLLFAVDDRAETDKGRQLLSLSCEGLHNHRHLRQVTRAPVPVVVWLVVLSIGSNALNFFVLIR